MVESQGIEIYFERGGDGPPLLFLNGSSSTIERSRPLLGLFAPDFELVVADHRGLGRSGPVPTRYDMAACAADARSVLDAAGWAEALVVGISFGGMIAQELAVSSPERVTRLALLCTSPGGAGGASYPLQELEELAPQARASARRRLIDTRFTDEWLASHPSDARLVALLEPPDTEVVGPDVGFRRQLEARSTHDVWDRLATIRCPTFVGCGRFDGIAPVANGEHLASQVPGSILRVYEGGHLFLVQDRRALPDVLGFLRGES